MTHHKQSRKYEDALIQVDSYASGFYQVASRFAALAIANKLSGTEWAVWSFLCMSNPYADKTKSGERKYKRLPSTDEIAAEVGRHVKAVIRAMKRLEDLGLYLFRYEFREGYNSTAEAAKTKLEPVVVEAQAELNNSRINLSNPELNSSSRTVFSNPELFSSSGELKVLPSLPFNFSHTISYSNQTSSHSLNDFENTRVSPFGDSLRSTSQPGIEEENPSTKIDLASTPKSSVITEDLGNMPDLSYSMKKECEIKTNRSATSEVNKIGGKNAANCAETRRSDVLSLEKAPQAPMLLVNAESYFVSVLNGVMPKEAWDYGELVWWGNLTDKEVRFRHESVMQIQQLVIYLQSHGIIPTSEIVEDIYMLGNDDLLWPALDASETATVANAIGDWFVVEGDEVVMYVGTAMKEPYRVVVVKLSDNKERNSGVPVMNDETSAVESAYDDGDIEGAIAAAEAIEELEAAAESE